MGWAGDGGALFVIHLLGTVAVVAVSVVTAWWVRRQTRDRAGTVMTYLLTSHAVMGVLLSAQLSSSTLASKALWHPFWYAFVLANPVAWFLFAVYYTGREHWLSRPVWAWLLGVGLVPAGLMLTNPLHHLLVSGYALGAEPFVHLEPSTTGLTAVVLALAYAHFVAGFALLLRMLLVSRRTTRRQLLGLLGGMAVIFVPAYASLTAFAPVAEFPYGVLGAGVFGVIVADALFRTRTFAVAPLARDTLFESLEDAIVVVDAERRIVDFNERAIDVFPDIERHETDSLDDAYPELLGASGEDDGGSDARFAESIQVTDGEPRTYRVAVSEITRGGELRGYGLVVRDVTELEAHAAELERQNERLERFASVLSHDLRNPITVAMGRTQLELERRESEDLETALSALDRVEETISDLLALTREGATIDDPSEVSLRSVVEDAWSTSETGNGSLEVDLDHDVSVVADRSRLRTLLENLFRNSVDHGGETVRVGHTDDGFYVADDGPGIPPEEREAVFEYGYSSREGGTGFGLAIVDSIATAHGWSLAVAESADGGARFELGNVEAT